MTEQALENLQKFVNGILSCKKEIKILEAGCGSTTYLKFEPKAYFVGIDISGEQLARNNLLAEKIHGDIQTYPLTAIDYDVIVCWNVLEHVSRPQLALEKFSIALVPEGILILSLPNVLSLKGLITKFTPHIIHVLVHRYVYGNKDAGKDGTAPFKTYMRFIISPEKIVNFAEDHELRVVYLDYYDIQDYLRTRNRLFYQLYFTLSQIFGFLSFCKLGDSEFYIVLQKKGSG